MMKNDQVGRWKKEELIEWNEDIIIQVPRLMLEASTMIWKLERLNIELKTSKYEVQDDPTRVMSFNSS